MSPANPDYRTFASANDKTPLGEQSVLATGRGYRSATTEHFNWSMDSKVVTLTVPASQVGV